MVSLWLFYEKINIDKLYVEQRISLAIDPVVDTCVVHKINSGYHICSIEPFDNNTTITTNNIKSISLTKGHCYFILIQSILSDIIMINTQYCSVTYFTIPFNLNTSDIANVLMDDVERKQAVIKFHNTLAFKDHIIHTRLGNMDVTIHSGQIYPFKNETFQRFTCCDKDTLSYLYSIHLFEAFPKEN